MSEKNEFYCGYAAAIGALIRLHDEKTMAIDVMNCDGVTVSDLEKAGVEDFDLKPIREAAND